MASSTIDLIHALEKDIDDLLSLSQTLHQEKHALQTQLKRTEEENQMLILNHQKAQHHLSLLIENLKSMENADA
jgi:FtsZ-binding cell division protein ZapB